MTEARGTGAHDGGRDTERPRPPSPAAMPGRPPTPGSVPGRPPIPGASVPAAAPGEPTSPPSTGLAAEQAGGDSQALEDLRTAASGLDALEHTDDPGEHADRFEAVHDALVAVLADVDRT